MSKFVYMTIYRVEYGFDPSGLPHEEAADWTTDSARFAAVSTEDALKKFRTAYKVKMYRVTKVEETDEGIHVYVA